MSQIYDNNNNSIANYINNKKYITINDDEISYDPRKNEELTKLFGNKKKYIEVDNASKHYTNSFSIM